LTSAGCGARAPGAAGPPPIAPREGPLVIDVVYPSDSSRVAARDSNFIFGSVGNGSARLSINGREVTVEPNGAFLAFLPVPGAAGDTLADYELVARLGDEQARAVRTIRLPRPADPLAGDSAAIRPGSGSPAGAWWVRAGERVPLSVRATPNASVRLLLPGGGSVELAESWEAGVGSAANWIFGRVPSAGAVRFGSGLYQGELLATAPLGRGLLSPDLLPVTAGLSSAVAYCAPPAAPVSSDVVADSAEALPDPATERNESVTDSVMLQTVEPAAGQALPPECAVIEVVFGGDTARAPLPLDLWMLGEPGPVVELKEQPSSVGQDGFVVGRAAPGATTLWMWSDGVRARVSGRRNGSVRLALDHATEAWVDLRELIWLPGAALPERARVGTVRLSGEADRVRVRISVSGRVPYHVETDGARFSLMLYGAYSNTDWLRYGPEDEFVRSARWEQVTSDRYVLKLELAGEPWGYRVRHNGAGLSVEIRKPPPVDSKRPLSGLTIVVDPGHPPAGATGPTRLYEGDANLAVAFHLRRLLEEEGADVVLTRADREPVRLYDRTRLAEMLDAHMLVSIHNNALPDGVNPFENNGTSVYYFHRQSLDLAAALQAGLLESMGLADLGFGRASLALARPSWVPAALTEGAFMMIPDQEAGLRDPAFQEAYARGVLEGMRAFVLGRME
jgi:N-acetylmuramoyl-L-alanine amidase